MELSRQSPSGIKLSFHVVGWLIFFFAPVILSPGRDIEAYFSEAPIITSLVLRNILLMIFFYANLFYLTPKLFTPKSQATFFFVMALLIMIVGSVNYYIHEILNGPFEGFRMGPPKGGGDFRPPPDFPENNRPPRRLMLASPYFSSLLITALVATASTLLVLWNNWIKAKEDEQERTLQKVAAELSMLKLQISPHFLFNTLNNIRWLVRSKSDNAEPSLLKLSQLLRYILYQADANFVSLDKEIAHLHDYVSLQKMRLEENSKINLAITYSEVSSIFQSSCAKNSNCHASGSNHGPGALVNYSQIYNARSEIKRAVSNGSMPRDGRLSSDDKNAILCWIENGASNN